MPELLQNILYIYVYTVNTRKFKARIFKTYCDFWIDTTSKTTYVMNMYTPKLLKVKFNVNLTWTWIMLIFNYHHKFGYDSGVPIGSIQGKNQRPENLVVLSLK